MKFTEKTFGFTLKTKVRSGVGIVTELPDFIKEKKYFLLEEHFLIQSMEQLFGLLHKRQYHWLRLLEKLVLFLLY